MNSSLCWLCVGEMGRALCSAAEWRESGVQVPVLLVPTARAHCLQISVGHPLLHSTPSQFRTSVHTEQSQSMECLNDNVFQNMKGGNV